MRLNRATDEALLLDVTTDIDPATATLLVSVDGAAFVTWPWTGAATTADGKWTRTGMRQYRGPDADPSSSPVLALGRHTVKWRLTGIDPEKPVRDADPIDVT